MQTTRYRLSEPVRGFFHDMSEALQLKPYFYGSVQRNDFFPGKSDIDVSFFSGNIDLTARRLALFLQKPFSSIRRVVWDIRGTVIPGYKAKYCDSSIGLNAEVSLYETKYQSLVREELQLQLPFAASFLIRSIKFLYYTIGIIPKEQYKYWKRIILARCNEDSANFLVW